PVVADELFCVLLVQARQPRRKLVVLDRSQLQSQRHDFSVRECWGMSPELRAPSGCKASLHEAVGPREVGGWIVPDEHDISDHPSEPARRALRRRFVCGRQSLEDETDLQRLVLETRLE